MNPNHETPGPSPAQAGPSKYVAVVLALLLGLALGAGALQWHHASGAQQQALERQAQEAMLATLKKQLAGVQAAADALAGELVVERSTIEGLQAALAQTQASLGQSRDALAFYEQLIPPGPKGSLSIRAFSLQPGGSSLRYRVLLSRNAASGRPFAGRLQFIAHGSVKGRAVSQELTAAVVPDGEASRALDLEFHQFQRQEGLLGMPEHFFPERVVLNVLEGDTVRASTEVIIEPGN